ncbi:MAG: hypothetical protein PHF60_04750 [Candidatus ainarchaeum sp.]|nr:hypothetical protein [Candidatus ainarchaeum sp.]
MAGEFFIDHTLAYRTATSEGKARDIRRLPLTMQNRFKEQVERIPIPSEPTRRGGFLKALAGMGERSLLKAQLGILMAHDQVPPECVEEELECAVKLFAMLGPAVEIAFSSVRPIRYMELMARSEFDIGDFLSSMDLFVERKVVFEEVPEDRKALSEELARALTGKPPEAAERLVQIVKEQLPRLKEIGIDDPAFTEPERRYLERIAIKSILYGFQGEHIRPLVDAAYPKMDPKDFGAIGERAKLRAQKINLMNVVLAYEMMRDCGMCMLFEKGDFLGLAPFDRSFYHGHISVHVASNTLLLKRLHAKSLRLGPRIVLGSDAPNELHHELQHLFDGMIGMSEDDFVGYEYRAALAEMAFTPEPWKGAESISSRLQSLVRIQGRPESVNKTIEALTDIYRKVLIRCRNDELGDRSRELLEAAYLAKVGMDYDYIIGPFRKRE